MGIVFEKYLLYCNNCGVIGHSIQQCKRLATDQVEVNKTAMKNKHYEVNKKVPVHSSKNVTETIEDAIISEHTLAKIADGSRGKATIVDYSIGNVTINIIIQSNLANIADEPLTFNLSDPICHKDGMNCHNSDNPICSLVLSQSRMSCSLVLSQLF